MATVYSGQLRIVVKVHPYKDEYHTSIYQIGSDKRLWKGVINPPRAFSGSLDSRKAIMRNAQAAISFADHEKPRAGISDLASHGEKDYVIRWNSNRSGRSVTRPKRTRTAKVPKPRRAWKVPKYKGNPQVVAREYREMAKFYAKLARDDDKFNQDRKKRGLPVVKGVSNKARKHRARAKKLLELAKRRSGVFSRDRRR